MLAGFFLFTSPVSGITSSFTFFNSDITVTSAHKDDSDKHTLMRGFKQDRVNWLFAAAADQFSLTGSTLEKPGDS